MVLSISLRLRLVTLKRELLTPMMFSLSMRFVTFSFTFFLLSQIRFFQGQEVYVWIGKGSSPRERRNGIQYAQKYLVDFNRPKALPIHRILEGNNQKFIHDDLSELLFFCLNLK
jgi:hypothetical protein